MKTRDGNYALKFFLSSSCVSVVFLMIFWRYFFFRSSNLLPGDSADSRYTTSLYEHWYKFFTGDLSLTQNYFFYPFKNSMSFSDAYLAQGLIHAFFRFSGLNILDSWQISTILIHALGCISCILIGYSLKLRIFPTLILLIFWNFNSVIWVQRGHLQNIAYMLIGFCVWITILIYTRKYSRLKSNIAMSINLNLSILIALSASYIFVFSIYLIVVYIMLRLLVSENEGGSLRFRKRRDIAEYTRSRMIQIQKNVLHFYPAILSVIPAIVLFLYIYIFSAENLTTRSPSEASFYSPTFSELIEVPPDNIFFGKLISRLFAGSFQATGERYMGFTPIFILSFMFCMYKVIMGKLDFGPLNKNMKYCFLAIIACEIIILRDARGFNLWYVTGSRLPLFEAIRGMSRFHQAIYMIGGLLIAITINKILNLKINKYKFTNKEKVIEGRLKFKFSRYISQTIVPFFTPLVLLCLFAGETSTYYGTWNSNDYQNIVVANEEYLKNNCESFILEPSERDFEERAWYLWLIDAQILATDIEIPTISGYSGGQPSRYSLDYSSHERLAKTLENYSVLGEMKNVCKITRNSKNRFSWEALPLS